MGTRVLAAAIAATLLANAGSARADGLDWRAFLEALSSDAPAETGLTGSETPSLDTAEDLERFYRETLSSGEYSLFSLESDKKVLSELSIAPARLPDGTFDPTRLGGPNPALDAYLESLKFPDEESFLRALRETPDRVNGDPWTFLKYPAREVRARGFRWYFESDESVTFFTGEWRERLRGLDARLGYLRDPRATPFTSNGPETTLPKPGDRSKIPAVGAGVAGMDSLRWAACVRFAGLAAAQCAKALGRILDLMTPVGMLTALPVLEKIVAEEAYAEGASKAALAIAEKAKRALAGEVFDAGDLFDDVVRGYLDAGLDAANAERMAWDLMAVYGARGANVCLLFPFASGKPGGKTLVALESIAMSAGLLDSAARSPGRLYSLPKSIGISGMYGKPYHFWMSAYLSNRFTRELGSEAGVRAAVSIVELGYQMFSTTGGREKHFQKLLTGGLHSSAAAKTRVDLAVGYAGATWGAARAAGRREAPIDVDRTVREMTRGASGAALDGKVVDEALKHPVKRLLLYRRWMSRLTPFLGLRSVERQAGCASLLRKAIRFLGGR